MSDWLVRKITNRMRPPQARKWLRVLTGMNGEALNHRVSRAYFTKYMRNTLGHFLCPADAGPFPPRELIMRTFVLDEKDAEKKLNPDFYFSSGYSHLLWWLQTAERHGFNIRTAEAILDFGVGTARFLRHLRCIDGIRLVGTDLYPPNVEWNRQAFPELEFHVNQLAPPLTFAEDNTFDLVYAASVFTHIPLETQDAWIGELCRVLKPGGFLVCDVLGKFHQDAMLGPDDILTLHRDGKLTVTQDDARASLATKLIGSWDVFQTHAEVLKAFRKHFTVLDYIPAKLDTLVLRKP